MKKDDCIFCKLANGEIPTNALYEDDIVKVIFDASPAAKGHVLILPKEHFDNIYELDDDTAAHVFKVAAKISKAYKKELDVTDIISYRITGKWPVRPYSISICILFLELKVIQLMLDGFRELQIMTL